MSRLTMKPKSHGHTWLFSQLLPFDKYNVKQELLQTLLTIVLFWLFTTACLAQSFTDYTNLDWYGRLEEYQGKDSQAFLLFRADFQHDKFRKKILLDILNEEQRAALYADAITELVFAEAERNTGTVEAFLVFAAMKDGAQSTATVTDIVEMTQKMYALLKSMPVKGSKKLWTNAKPGIHFEKLSEKLANLADTLLYAEIIARIVHGAVLSDSAIDALNDLENQIKAIPNTNIDPAIIKALKQVRHDRLDIEGITASIAWEKADEIAASIFGMVKRAAIKQVLVAAGPKVAVKLSFYLMPVALALDGINVIERQLILFSRSMLQLTVAQYLMMNVISKKPEIDAKTHAWIHLCRYKAFENCYNTTEGGITSYLATKTVAKVANWKAEFARLRDEALLSLDELSKAPQFGQKNKFTSENSLPEITQKLKRPDRPFLELPLQTNDGMTLEVLNNYVETTNDNYIIQADNLTLSGPSPGVVGFNNLLKNQLDKHITEFTRLAAHPPEDPDFPSKLVIKPFALSLSRRLISVGIEKYEYISGGRGNLHYHFLNFDLMQSKTLSPEKLLLPFDKGIETCAQMLRPHLNAYEEIDPDLFLNGWKPIPANYRNIGYSPFGLVIVYKTYQIAGGMNGNIFCLIPWAKLVDYRQFPDELEQTDCSIPHDIPHVWAEN